MRSCLARLLLALALPCGACSSDASPRSDGGAPPTDAASRGDAAMPTTAEFFRNDAMHRIELTLDPAEWQRFMAENRDLNGTPQWHQGDIRIDGIAVSKVGFKTFGFGSRMANPEKPNLNLEFDHFVAGQSFADKSRLRVKNNGQDLSGLRQPITYEALRAAGLWAPLTSFATLVVNGEEYGFYTIEESFTKSFVRDRGALDTGAAYESGSCQGFVPPAGGCAQLVETYGRPFNPTVGVGEDLTALCTALSGPASGVLAALAPVIDVQAWARGLAVDLALAGDNDGFDTAGTNYRLYHDPGSGKLQLILYGPDTSYDPDVPAPDPKAPAPSTYCASFNPAYKDIFLQKLLGSAAGLALYRTEVQALRQGGMSPARIKARADALWQVVRSAALADRKRDMTEDLDYAKDSIGLYMDKRVPQLIAAGL